MKIVQIIDDTVIATITLPVTLGSHYVTTLAKWQGLHLVEDWREYIAPEPTIVEPEVYVPQEISRAKGLVICKQYGILDTIKEVVAAKDAEDGISQIKFDNAGTFNRTDPLLQYVAGLTNLTEEQLDVMFIEAEALWA
jgi:hypothetical protein